MALVLQVLVTGLAAGAGYGLVAIAYALIYRLTGVVHLALGQLGNVAMFAVLLALAGPGLLATPGIRGSRVAAAVVAGLAASGLAGVVVHAVAVRPFLRRRSVVGWIGGVVAAAFAIRGGLEAVLSRPGYVLPDVFRFDHSIGGGLLHVGRAVIPVRACAVLVAGALLAAGATWFLQRTRTDERCEPRPRTKRPPPCWGSESSGCGSSPPRWPGCSRAWGPSWPRPGAPPSARTPAS